MTTNNHTIINYINYEKSQITENLETKKIY